MNKYNISAKSCRTYDGIVFDSALEMRYYRDVVLPKVAAGEIVDYQLQRKYQLLPKFLRDGKTIRATNYVCDFYLVYADGRTAIIDIKGLPTAEAKLKKKMFMYFYPDENIVWIVYSKKHGGWITYEEYTEAKKTK